MSTKIEEVAQVGEFTISRVIYYSEEKKLSSPQVVAYEIGTRQHRAIRIKRSELHLVTGIMKADLDRAEECEVLALKKLSV